MGGAAMVKTLDQITEKRLSNFWSRGPRWCCLIPLMMENINKDLIRFAKEQDLEVVVQAAQHGAWGDYADEDGNTALHHAIMAATSTADLFAEGRTLGLNMEEADDPLNCSPESQLKAIGGMKSSEAWKVLQQHVADFFAKVKLEYDIADVIMDYALADPRLENNNGENCFDLAKDKPPVFMAAMTAQCERLDIIEEEGIAEDPNRKAELKKKPKLRDFGDSWRDNITGGSG